MKLFRLFKVFFFKVGPLVTDLKQPNPSTLALFYSIRSIFFSRVLPFIWFLSFLLDYFKVQISAMSSGIALDNHISNQLFSWTELRFAGNLALISR